MLNIAVCDGFSQDLDLTCQYLKEYETLHKCEFHIDAYASGEQLLKALSMHKKYDIYFLDVLLPDENGIHLAQNIRSRNLTGLIIFLTSSAEHCLDAFRVKAMQYLLKPVREEDFFSVLTDAFEVLQHISSRYLAVSMPDGKQQIHFSSIIYVECKNRILYFHLTNGTILVSRSIRRSFEIEMHPLLEDSRFCRPHQSFIINMHYTSRISPSEIIMKDNSAIPISKKRIKEMRLIYPEFLSRQLQNRLYSLPPSL